MNPAQGEKKAILNTNEACSLLATDYVSSGIHSGKRSERISISEAKNKIKPLLEQCRRKIRKLHDDGRETFNTLKRLEVDGALLVRFLATKGVE